MTSIRAMICGEEPVDPFGGEVIVVEPDYRAAYAELAAQVRYLADDLDAMGKDWLQPWVVSGRLRALVEDWPHNPEEKV